MSREKCKYWDGERFRFPEYFEIETGDYFDTYRDVENGTPIKNLLVIKPTGVKDKHGVDIYEGDIIKLCEDKLGIRLVVQAYKTGFEFHQLNWGARLYESATEGEIEVIGNIHANPGLLK